MNCGKLFSVIFKYKIIHSFGLTDIMFRPNNEISQSALARKVTEENRFYKVYFKKTVVHFHIFSL